MKIDAFKISEILLKICLFQSVYTLHSSGYSYTGDNVGDEFSAQGESWNYHSGMAFTTFDNDNDNSGGNCAESYKGGWWYNSCYHSNLNGLNLGAGSSHSAWTGIVWYPWIDDNESAKSVYMAIK